MVKRFSWMLLIIAAPFLLFPNQIRSLALLAIPLVWIIGLVNKDNPLPASPLNGSILLMGVMVLVSLYATYDIELSLPKICGLVLGVGAFYAILRASRKASGWWFSLVLFVGTTTGIALVGFLGTNWFLEKIAILSTVTAKLPRLISGLPGAESGIHPNEIAGALLWGFPLLLAITGGLFFPRKKEIIFQNKWLARLAIWFMIVATIALGIELVLVQSRGSYLALAFAFAGSALILMPRKIRLAGFSVITLLIVAILVLMITKNLDRLLPTSLQVSITNNPAMSLDTLQGRVEVWSRAIYGIQDFPFTGMGMNTFRNVVKVLYPLFLVDPTFDIGHAHNEFLQAALDLGIPGLIAFISMYFIAFGMLVASWKILEKNPSVTAAFHVHGVVNASPLLLKTIVFGMGIGLCAHLLYGLTDVVAFGAKPGILLWLLLANITGLYLRVKHTNPVETFTAHSEAAEPRLDPHTSND